MTRTEIIQTIIDRIHGRRYLEIGVARGANFLRIKAPVKIAVDPFMAIPVSWIIKRVLRNPTNLFNRYIRSTSEDFFKTFTISRPFDVIFIDGLHTYEQSLRDVNNSLRALSPKGIILLHDCNPPGDASALPEPPKQETSKNPWCGEVWKTIVHLRATCPSHSIHVVDCDLGVGVMVPVKPQELLAMDPADIPSLTYNDLKANRAEWLNLVQPEMLDMVVAQL